MNLKIYFSNSVNPWFNLAIEDWLFQDLADFDHVLYLWRNDQTVVIGRSQNPWLECDLHSMERDHIYLARRQSGGGAVFQDMGNTNFTLISKKEFYDKEANTKIILDALKNFRINAKASGRNDIVVERNAELRKISGSAYKEKFDRAFHHGTLLINANLAQLEHYLSPNKKKLISKGIKSVRSRVANLTELNPKINHKNLTHEIIKLFQKKYKSKTQVEILDARALNKLPELQKRYEKLQSWDWLYGQTLEFTHHLSERFDWATIDMQCVIKNAKIEDLRIYSDSLFPELIECLQENLKGVHYNNQSIEDAIRKVDQKHSQYSAYLQQFQQWLVTAI